MGPLLFEQPIISGPDPELTGEVPRAMRELAHERADISGAHAVATYNGPQSTKQNRQGH
jgi:ABC-type histidine transport system ATPase subunit